MDKPEIPQKEPCLVEVKAGRKYWWCTCGRSKKQPFCDSSHKGTDFAPKMYETDRDRMVVFCGCKQTGNAPLCDGSHTQIKD